MVIHCTKKLANKLPKVSSAPEEEDSPLGSWHGQIYTIDHRRCVMFCHDLTRYILFLPGLRKAHLDELGGTWFRDLFFATLDIMGCPTTRINKVGLSLGPARFDTVTDRSVQGTMRIARQDLDAGLMRVANVLDLDPIAVACELNHRPATVHGKSIWPDRAMLELTGSI